MTNIKPFVDMQDLERKVRSKGPAEFAPPSIRGETGLSPIDQIESFGLLPTKDIDDIIESAEAQIASLKADAQIIRDDYTQRTKKLVSEIKRLQEGVKFSKDALAELRAKCERLNALDEEPK